MLCTFILVFRYKNWQMHRDLKQCCFNFVFSLLNIVKPTPHRIVIGHSNMSYNGLKQLTTLQYINYTTN